ncbi:uncharacterized oxidoreductase YrbE-like [Mytilus trossulus]|uniref:uncharacterized oxidoreductase YrbE-like n=1 Tax=Mytilus trossulus TaxID=6551 RepID=UPI003004028E
MERKNIGVIGIGRIGEVHLCHLVQSGQVNVTYLVDIEPVHGKIRNLVKQYGLQNVKVINTEEVTDMLSDKLLDAVLICSPVFGKPHKKSELVKFALQAGKHVFCEKPVDLDPSVVEECYKLAEDHGKTLQCGFDKRFDISIRKMYDKIKAGDLGKLRMIKLVARELPAWINAEYLKSSGGIVVDSAIHELDLICWLSGERPESAVCFGHSTNPMFKECYDVECAMIMLKFPSGLVGYIENVRGVPYGYDQRFEVLGDKGMLCIENPSTTHLQLWNEDGRLLDTIEQNGLPRYYEAYRMEKQHFIDVINGQASCEVLPDEVIFNSKLTQYCTKSLRTGTIVNIP